LYRLTTAILFLARSLLISDLFGKLHFHPYRFINDQLLPLYLRFSVINPEVLKLKVSILLVTKLAYILKNLIGFIKSPHFHCFFFIFCVFIFFSMKIFFLNCVSTKHVYVIVRECVSKINNKKRMKMLILF
jgi:hypothetical protein